MIVPTYCERQNIAILVERVHESLSRYNYELIVVDDNSPDGTSELAKSLSQKYPIRVITRKNKRGLASAVVDGFKQAKGEILGVMDADLQHPPEILPKLLGEARNGVEVVIASRYAEGGSSEGWSMKRKIISKGAKVLAKLLLPSIRGIKDPLSGFFLLRRKVIDGVALSPTGYKILLEVLVKGQADRVVEVPFTFVERKREGSKFTTKRIMDYLIQLAELVLYKLRRLIKFGIAELVGTVIIFALVWLLTDVAGLHYMLSLLLAAATGFFVKYGLNTAWTFAVRRNPDEADYEWSSYYRGHIVQRWWKGQIAKTVWHFVPHSSSLLDIGCGSSPIITRYPRAVGIDSNGRKLEFMRGKVPHATFMLMPADSLEFSDNSFDTVLCIEVLEHLEEPNRAMAEIARVLKTGGRVVIATPDYSKRLWYLAERFTPYKESHRYQFTKTSLESLCHQHGLEPLKHRYIMGCDLVELFHKPYSQEDRHYPQGSPRGDRHRTLHHRADGCDHGEL